MDYFLHVIVLIGIYSILAISLDLIAGQTGMLSLAHAAFYGIGAYTSALLSIHLGIPFLVALASGIAIAAGLSLLTSWPSARLHEDYFVVATFAFQVVTLNVLNNWSKLTGGPIGIADIPPPSVLGYPVESRAAFFVVVAIFGLLAFSLVYQVSHSPFGRVLRTIREDEILGAAFGKNTLRFKVTAFALGAAIAASAGSLYAHYMAFIDPSNFDFMQSVLILSMVMIGGADSMVGPLIGAIIIIALPEALRFLGLPSSMAGHLRQIFYGTLLVVVVVFRPRGLRGHYAFGR